MRPTDAQDGVAGPQLLQQAIRYHDPAGQWATFAHTLVLDEVTPDREQRETLVTLDLPHGRFVYDMRNERDHVRMVVEGDGCSATVNGFAEITPEDEDRYRLTCPRMRQLSNKYLYLWGLPMKLQDPGTIVASVAEPARFQERDVLRLRVTYEESVGTDTWYFYFDPTDFHLVGYRFYHDEAKNDGEYITLEGEYQLGEMRLPRVRHWYRNDTGRFYGEDHLVGHRSPGAPRTP
jgi:hypothetical protein